MTIYFWSSLALFLALLYSSRIDAAPPGKPTGCKPLYGVSYDPFSTSGEDICLSSEQVAIDVAIMATVAKSIRIYSIAVCPETTSTLFEESRKHNMTVLMGILINANAKDISAELSYLPKIMANYSDVVQAISVGNQALTGPKIGSKSRFASTMSNVELLTGYIRRVRSILRRRRYKHPVTTAETWQVWESSNGYPISATIDFICLNMSPFYEGFEVECLLSSKGRCTTASKYATGKADGLAEYFGQDVWVCETSWPTEGNSCCTGLQAYQQKGNKAKASASTATKYLGDFSKRAGDSPYYISSAFDKDWRRVWSPCGSCSEKNLHLSSFRNGVCDLCEEEYQLGLFDQYRERKDSYELPSVRCKLPSLPETRIAVEEPKEEEPTEETTIKLYGQTTKTKKGETKTVVRSSATTSKKEPVSKTKTDSKTTGEKESSTTAKTKATTKTSKSSATAKATSVVETSDSKTTKTVTSKTKVEDDDDAKDDDKEKDDDAKDDDE